MAHRRHGVHRPHPWRGGPAFIQDTFPAQGLEAAWQSYQAVFLDPGAALDTRTKELITHGVAAQVLKWSTMLNGSQYDEE